MHFILVTGRNEVVAKVMFLQVCVCPQGGRVSASVHAGMPDSPPPGTREHPPQDQAGRTPTRPGPGRTPTPPGPGRTPPGRPPRTRENPPDQAGRTPPPPRPGRTPPGPGRTPPRPGRHPPWEADFSIQSTSGRYASYWNAFLFSRNYTKLAMLADLPDLAFLCYSLALFSHAYLDISVLLIHEN